MYTHLAFPTYASYPNNHQQLSGYELHREYENDPMFSSEVASSTHIADFMDVFLSELFGPAIANIETPSFTSVYGPLESTGHRFYAYRVLYNELQFPKDPVVAGVLGLYHMYTDRDANAMAAYKSVWSSYKYPAKASIVYAHAQAEYMMQRWESMRNPAVKIHEVMRRRFDVLRAMAEEQYTYDSLYGITWSASKLHTKLARIASKYYPAEMDMKRWTSMQDGGYLERANYAKSKLVRVDEYDLLSVEIAVWF